MKQKSISCLILISLFFLQCSKQDYDKDSFKKFEEVYLLYNHSEAYVVWKKKNITDKILIHIDAHSDIKKIPNDRLTKVYAIEKTGKFENLLCHPHEMQNIYEKPITIGNFCYAALEGKIIKKYIWVVPDAELTSESIETYSTFFRRQIEDINFEDFKLDGNILKGEFKNIPIIICRLQDIPEVNESVILDIDVDFFLHQYGFSNKGMYDIPTTTAMSFISQLNEKNLNIDLITISHSMEGGYTPIQYKYIGEDIFKIYKNGYQEDLFSHIKTRRDILKLYFDEEYKKALSKLRKFEKHTFKDGSLLYLKKQILNKLELQDEALLVKKELLKENPFYSKEYLINGDVFFNEEKFDDALNFYKKFFDSNPTYQHALVKIAYLNFNYKNYDLATNNYKRLISINENNFNAYSGLARIYIYKKDYEKAKEYLGKAIKLNKLSPKYFNNMAICEYSLGNYNETKEYFLKVVELNPTYNGAYYNLGLLYKKLGDYQKSIEMLLKHLKTTSSYKKNVYKIIAENYQELGNLEEAKKYRSMDED